MHKYGSTISVLTAAMLAGTFVWAQTETTETGSTTESLITETAAPVESTAVAGETANTNGAEVAAPATTEENTMVNSVTPPAGNPVIIITTSKGVIKAELWPDKAPMSVSNFLSYAESHFYDGTIFHRVIKNFMIQGGGFTPDMNQKPAQAPIRNEARADVPNTRGTLAMARTFVIDSATSQFYINLVDNAFLNHRDESAQGFGYCVFGAVTEGLDVIDAIANVSTTSTGMSQDVPVEPVLIQSIELVK